MCKGIVDCTKGSSKGIAIYGHGKHHLWAVLACTKEVPTTCVLVLPPTDCLKRVLVTILLSTEGVYDMGVFSVLLQTALCLVPMLAPSHN